MLLRLERRALSTRMKPTPANAQAHQRRGAVPVAVATLVGLACLGAILWTLLARGVSGMSLQIFTQMTPSPGSSGGLLNAIYGSIVMTMLGIFIGAPLGILAGTYLAEYGRDTRLSNLVRFVNDVLLSAPSIIVGLFVYEVLVVPTRHFSAHRGRGGARHHCDTGDGAHDRGHAAARAAGYEGCLDRARRLSVAHDHERYLSGRAQRHRDRTAARHCPRERRDGAACSSRP